MARISKEKVLEVIDGVIKQVENTKFLLKEMRASKIEKW